MALNTFTWIPSYGADEDHKPRVIKIDFGDGYSQRLPDGLNTDLMKRNLSFQNRTTTEADAIIAFLKNEKGATAFYWTPPGGTQKKWTCDTYKRVNNSYNCDTITATFEEVVA